jgi:hypothetical protein
VDRRVAVGEVGVVNDDRPVALEDDASDPY